LLPIENSVGNISSGCGTAPARVKDVKPLRYVARQPIVDREERVFGYELLFRTDWRMRSTELAMKRRGQRWTGRA
jgi:hypothetical protein